MTASAQRQARAELRWWRANRVLREPIGYATSDEVTAGP